VTSLKGAIDAKESHKSSSDAMFDETVDLSCADVKTEGSGTHFSDCAFQTQIKQLAMEDKSNYETILRGLDLLSCSVRRELVSVKMLNFQRKYYI